MPGPRPRTRAQVLAAVMARLEALGLPEAVCWPWPGARTTGGYGLVQARALADGPLYVHRLAHEAATGTEPFEGTALDNAADMASKGRGWWQREGAR